MGHSITYIKGNNKKDIMSGAIDFAFYEVDPYENPDRSYHGNLKFEDNRIFDSYEKAGEYLATFEGWYNDRAVRFYDLDSTKKTKSQENLESKLSKLDEQIEKLNLKNRKSKTVSCKKCKTVNIIAELKGKNVCECCGADLRSDANVNKEKGLKEKQKEIKKQIKKFDDNRIKKAPIKWLAKIEVHC